MVLHTVGPQWQGGDAGESRILNSCYEKCLQMGLSEGASSIAFPAISTGVYGYPKRQAAVIALSAMQPYIDRYKKIIACCYSDSDVWIYQKVMESLRPN
jgi:O-acetyl-ADP-ribose deacetylase (regulator of RNase III)